MLARADGLAFLVYFKLDEASDPLRFCLKIDLRAPLRVSLALDRNSLLLIKVLTPVVAVIGFLWLGGGTPKIYREPCCLAELFRGSCLHLNSDALEWLDRWWLLVVRKWSLHLNLLIDKVLWLFCWHHRVLRNFISNLNRLNIDLWFPLVITWRSLMFFGLDLEWHQIWNGLGYVFLFRWLLLRQIAWTKLASRARNLHDRCGLEDLGMAVIVNGWVVLELTQGILNRVYLLMSTYDSVVEWALLSTFRSDSSLLPGLASSGVPWALFILLFDGWFFWRLVLLGGWWLCDAISPH